MALTPDEIERRTFTIADWGYDRGEVHKFLVEVAATLRYAQHAAVGAAPGVIVDRPVSPPVATAAAPEASLLPDDGVDLARVGEQVTRILEAAEGLAAGLRAEAEQELLAARAEAEQAAADRRREADGEAQAIRDQAKRVLIAAQEQAARITAEAEDEAAALRAAADRRVRARTDRIERVARQHADRVVRFERDAVRRLEEARSDLERAVERLTGSPERPVVDLSRPRPAVRTGELEDPAEVPWVGVVGPDAEPVSPTVPAAVEPPPDPVSNLVRAAVERAVEHSSAKAGARPAASRSRGDQDPPAPPS